MSKKLPSLNNINDLVRLSKTSSAVQVKCGPNKIIPSLAVNLIKVAKFFESALNVKKSNKKQASSKVNIDLSKFCSDDDSLVTLVQFANTLDTIDFQWSVSATVNLLVSDQLQLSSAVNSKIFANIEDYYFSNFDKLLNHVSLTIAARECTSMEIENVLRLLKHCIDKIKKGSFDVVSDSNATDTSSEPESGSCESRTIAREIDDSFYFTVTSIFVLAIWLKYKSDREEHAPFFHLSVIIVDSSKFNVSKYFGKSKDVLEKWVKIAMV